MPCILYKYETYIYPRFNYDVKVQINSKVQISPWVKFLVKKVTLDLRVQIYTRWFKIVLKGPILKVYNTYILFITSADGILITCLSLEKSPFANRKSSSLVLYIPGKVYFCTNEICGSHLAKNYITLVK